MSSRVSHVCCPFVFINQQHLDIPDKIDNYSGLFRPLVIKELPSEPEFQSMACVVIFQMFKKSLTGVPLIPGVGVLTTEIVFQETPV